MKNIWKSNKWDEFAPTTPKPVQQPVDQRNKYYKNNTVWNLHWKFYNSTPTRFYLTLNFRPFFKSALLPSALVTVCKNYGIEKIAVKFIITYVIKFGIIGTPFFQSEWFTAIGTESRNVTPMFLLEHKFGFFSPSFRYRSPQNRKFSLICLKIRSTSGQFRFQFFNKFIPFIHLIRRKGMVGKKSLI